MGNSESERLVRSSSSTVAVAVRVVTVAVSSTSVLLASLRAMEPTTEIAPGAMARMVRAAEISGYSGGPVSPAALVPRPG